MDYKPLKYIYKASGNPTATTLLMLPGTGADENDLLPLALKFGSDINILSVRGNVLENGMPRFFKRLSMGVFDENDLMFRTHELVAFIKDISDKEKFDVNKVVAIGYSNGANIAGSILFLYPDLLAGAILYRPMQPYEVLDPEIKNTRNTPVFMSNGADDPTISLSDIQVYAETVKNAGFDVSTHVLSVGHQLTQDDLKISLDWFGRRFRQILTN